ncbi:MAG: IclR family transcriptional regulator [Caldilinea sp.]|nr:IclR family transcriptional regulator [Caldilinea sp.]MCB0067372.1 IclR family transcriptional regulator [Caldilineaceae bacterium]MCB0040392.1 IclR family transcriptional regulator [Caldilinea sp.]MCB0149607.1 IclR family transcriptional regulator [Caldilineaceae bacterium]MCB9114958.1 IclR family transcriptional regulator [Caldilineaceae bacterium]
MLQTKEIDLHATETYPGTQAVARAIALLKAFSDAQPEWNLTDLAQATGLNKTTAFRLLAALEAERLVMRNPLSGGYRLGVELIAMGGTAMRSNPLRAASRPILVTLAEQCGEAATLELLVESYVLVVDEVASNHPMGMTQDVGNRLPAHATATGKVLLAALPDAQLDAMLPGPLARLTDQTIVDPQRLRAELTQVRQDGFVVASGELEPGFVAVAAPVQDRERQVVAAISVGGPSLRLTPDRLPEIAAMVQMSARQISRQLGYWPG